MDQSAPDSPPPFTDPDTTATGEQRASVNFRALETLWFNTGTLCNIECAHCYIESSPLNDRLVYLRAAEVSAYLDEIAALQLPTQEIGLTGGEPFMNPDIIAILDDILTRGFEALVLTNAMKPMEHYHKAIQTLMNQHGAKLTFRVSLDHYTAEEHEAERGAGHWQSAIDGLKWLADNGATITIAGRSLTHEDEDDVRAGYQTLLDDLGITLDASQADQLTLFPEMDQGQAATEITTSCWDTLNVSPADQMCATSRMVVKRKGAENPVVLACTLLPYDPQFEMGKTLKSSFAPVKLNHPHCSQFCVLGGASCS